jgi:hypothetical protein
LIYRNKKLLELIRQSPCQSCGRSDGTVVAAHSNQLRDGKGRGIKAHDYRVAALCYSCHMNLDQGKSLDRAERVEIWEEAHRKTIAWLFENNHIELR